MKNIKDLEAMKNQKCAPFENAYVYFFGSLEDYFISKVDGIARIKDAIKDYDTEARQFIIYHLIETLTPQLPGFNANDLLQLIND